jgi:hypothetical protein
MQMYNPPWSPNLRFTIRSCGFAAVAIALAGCPATPAPIVQKQEEYKLTYPETRRDGQVDDYHGTKVADPYRWLEDPDSPETTAWVAEQNKVTFGYLERIAARDRIRQRLTKLWDYERFGMAQSPRRQIHGAVGGLFVPVQDHARLGSRSTYRSDLDDR